MKKNVIVSLPVGDLERSKEFFGTLGFRFQQEMSDETAATVIMNESMWLMLLTEEFYRSFTKRPVGDARQTSEVIVTVSAGSREEVDEFWKKAEKAGATLIQKMDQMEGMMYNILFNDLDGHVWEVVWMDEAAMENHKQ